MLTANGGILNPSVNSSTNASLVRVMLASGVILIAHHFCRRFAYLWRLINGAHPLVRILTKRVV
jgi:hypothetical protein